MYYVEIDLDQLQMRLMDSGECDPEQGRDSLRDWLHRTGFSRNGRGFVADADAMNRLSCSEITFSEPATRHAPRGMRLVVAMDRWRRTQVLPALQSDAAYA